MGKDFVDVLLEFWVQFQYVMDVCVGVFVGWVEIGQEWMYVLLLFGWQGFYCCCYDYVGGVVLIGFGIVISVVVWLFWFVFVLFFGDCDVVEYYMVDLVFVYCFQQLWYVFVFLEEIYIVYVSVVVVIIFGMG